MTGNLQGALNAIVRGANFHRGATRTAGGCTDTKIKREPETGGIAARFFALAATVGRGNLCESTDTNNQRANIREGPCIRVLSGLFDDKAFVGTAGYVRVRTLQQWAFPGVHRANLLGIVQGLRTKGKINAAWPPNTQPKAKEVQRRRGSGFKIRDARACMPTRERGKGKKGKTTGVVDVLTDLRYVPVMISLGGKLKQKEE